MQFVFQTSNLNDRLYKRLIRKNLYCQFTDKHERDLFFKWTRDNNYTFFIRPMSMASKDPFFHGKDGVGGVTDMKKMILYLEDKDEPPKDSVQRVLRKNAIVISHESGHLKGMFAGASSRVPLRNDDEMGHRKGTALNRWTQEVHDRDIENIAFVLNFWFWDWKTFKAHKYAVKVIDFRDVFEGSNI